MSENVVFFGNVDELPKDTLKKIKKDLKDGYGVRYLTMKYGTIRKVIIDIRKGMK